MNLPDLDFDMTKPPDGGDLYAIMASLLGPEVKEHLKNDVESLSTLFDTKMDDLVKSGEFDVANPRHFAIFGIEALPMTIVDQFGQFAEKIADIFSAAMDVANKQGDQETMAKVTMATIQFTGLLAHLEHGIMKLATDQSLMIAFVAWYAENYAPEIFAAELPREHADRLNEGIKAAWQQKIALETLNSIMADMKEEANEPEPATA